MRRYTDNQYLTEDLKAGRTEAFEYLFSTYHPRLRNYASHFIADADDVNDIIQDCFMHLWERRESLTHISIRSLLFTMVRNGCLNHLKHQVLVDNFSIDYLARVNGSELLYHRDFLNKADGQLLYDDLCRQIKKVLETLPPRSRRIFEMSRVEGLRNREIAEQMGITVKVVEKHISKALASFRKQLPPQLTTESLMLLIIMAITK